MTALVETKTNFHQCVACNKQGRDFVVGDIHAAMHLLECALDKVEFDKGSDRLFCLGDLIDRGDNNQALIALLGQPWFFSLRGNHEQMLLNRFDYSPMAHWLDGGKNQHEAHKLHVQNGGHWFDEMDACGQEAIYHKLSQLPVAMTLETQNGRLGLVHAEVPQPFEDWLRFIAQLETQGDVRHEALWSRWFVGDVYDFHHHVYLDPALDTRWVANVDATVHGHTPVREPVVNGNQLWIDTANITGELTILNASEVFERLEHSKKRYPAS